MEYAKEFEGKTKTILDSFRSELIGFRTNRPNAKLVENVKVEYAGSLLTVNQLGSIGIEPPRDVFVTVWDKSAVPAILKAIESANLGLNPQSEANGIRMKFPGLTEERKKELQKSIRAAAEEAKIKMRIARDEINKKIARETDENVKFKAKSDLQKTVDQFNSEVAEAVENKLRDL
ncbi:MAG: ribosome-recycling factor [Patescibacteria group bacterium]|nr:ribosome-recycling factor [Patescibacteria group bacterium]